MSVLNLTTDIEHLYVRNIYIYLYVGEALFYEIKINLLNNSAKICLPLQRNFPVEMDPPL